MCDLFGNHKLSDNEFFASRFGKVIRAQQFQKWAGRSYLKILYPILILKATLNVLQTDSVGIGEPDNLELSLET